MGSPAATEAAFHQIDVPKPQADETNARKLGQVSP
jgi:hypothetical protein